MRMGFAGIAVVRGFGEMRDVGDLYLQRDIRVGSIMSDDTSYSEPSSDSIVLRTDIRTDTRIYQVDVESPEGFGIIAYAQNGSPKLDRTRLVDYLRTMRIVSDGNRIYMFDGRAYMPISEDYLAGLIEDIVGRCPGAPFITRSTRADIIASVRVRNTFDRMDIPEAFWEDERYQSDYPLIPFQNGLYNIDRDELEPFTPFIPITHVLGAYYQPAVTTHPVEDIYKGILPDDATREAFYELVGYSVYSESMAPPAIITIYGPGNTGKTALQEAMSVLAGRENVSNLDIGQIGEGFLTAELCGKLVNISGETGSGTKGGITKSDGELLKRLSDGQSVKVQRKYSQPFDLENHAKLWFVTNTLPDFGDTSSGLHRRLRIIPCRQAQRWEDQIYSRMQEESAISWLANRCLVAYLRFLRRGSRFLDPEQMKVEQDAFRTQEPLLDFLEDYCGSLDPKTIVQFLDEVDVRDAYASYQSFVLQTGGKPWSMRRFSERIRNEFRLTTYKTRGVQEDGRPTTVARFSASSWRFRCSRWRNIKSTVRPSSTRSGPSGCSTVAGAGRRRRSWIGSIGTSPTGRRAKSSWSVQPRSARTGSSPSTAWPSSKVIPRKA